MKAGSTPSEKNRPRRPIFFFLPLDHRIDHLIDAMGKQCSTPTGGPTLLLNLPLMKEHTSMWASIPSPSCAYLEGSLLSRVFAFPSSSPLHRCTPPSSVSGSSLASAALSLSLSGGRTPFFLLSLSGSGTMILLA
jgi:hypothetical protein